MQDNEGGALRVGDRGYRPAYPTPSLRRAAAAWYHHTQAQYRTRRIGGVASYSSLFPKWHSIPRNSGTCVVGMRSAARSNAFTPRAPGTYKPALALTAPPARITPQHQCAS
eukprot:937320-Rhodomonas_salina.1